MRNFWAFQKHIWTTYRFTISISNFDTTGRWRNGGFILTCQMLTFFSGTVKTRLLTEIHVKTHVKNSRWGWPFGQMVTAPPDGCLDHLKPHSAHLRPFISWELTRCQNTHILHAKPTKNNATEYNNAITHVCRRFYCTSAASPVQTPTL
jgi:hypothetical protein